MTADRCDRCGRFIAEPATVISRMWWAGDGMNYDESRICTQCNRAGINPGHTGDTP